MQQYGYIRVSTKDQNPERQFLAMQGRGIPPKYIYLDKMSGKDFQRTGYQKLMKKLKKGDLLVIKSIDRLGRNYGEILEQWRKITREIGADIEVLDMPLLNTVTDHDDLTGVFISDLVLQILAYVNMGGQDTIEVPEHTACVYVMPDSSWNESASYCVLVMVSGSQETEPVLEEVRRLLGVQALQEVNRAALGDVTRIYLSDQMTP